MATPSTANPPQIDITFRNSGQEMFFGFTKRNSCFSGGFGNGKTYVACEKGIMLCLAFPKYRIVIARRTFKDLKNTTMATFFKVLKGGKESEHIARHSDIEGVTKFKNGSEVLWLHLDLVDEMSLRGLEVNSVIIDQGEEISEGVYLTLDARVGRWDQAEVPAYLNPDNFPKDMLGRPRPPSYMMVLCNPDAEYHWIWRRYHPDSPEWQEKFRTTHDYVERGTDESMYDPSTIREIKSRDPEWQKRFFEGKWGISEASIHVVRAASILTVPKEWVINLLQKSNLYRSLDHGEASPTCCTWWANFNGMHFCYREYYVPGRVISYHRQEIDGMSEHFDERGDLVREKYAQSVADPAIFLKGSQKNGSFWTTANEYLDTSLAGPPIAFSRGDNNELSTRNRINELLALSAHRKHPLSGDSPSPGIFYIKPIPDTNFGCDRVVMQTRMARRKILDTINGKIIYSDDRDSTIEDHAYDTERYYVALHSQGMPQQKRDYAPGTMGETRKRFKALKKSGYFKQYAR